MATRDNRGNLIPTVWTAEDQFGSSRRGNAGTTLTLELVDRDAQGFKTPYRHVRIHMKSKTGDVEFLLNGPEASAFGNDVLTFSREAQRVLPANPAPQMMTEPVPTVPVPSSEPAPVRRRARR